MKTKITNLRGTIFTQFIPLNNESLTKILPLFPNFSVEMVPTGSEGPFPVFSWSLKSNIEDCRIVFGNAGIDILKNLNVTFDEQIIKEFAAFCQDSYEKINSQYRNAVSRMALAPTLKMEFEDNREFVSLTTKIASTKDFKSTPISTMSFSDVYRVKETIMGQDVLINFVSNFSTAEDINTDKKTVVFVADINTYQNLLYKFDKNHLSDFYQKVAGWYSECYHFYFDN
jgi:hypothetical protein